MIWQFGAYAAHCAVSIEFYRGDQSRANYRGCSNRYPSKSALLRSFLMQATVRMSGAKKRAHARLSVELQASRCHSANSLEMNLTFSESFSL